jgi:fatty acid-binding protein DegV
MYNGVSGAEKVRTRKNALNRLSSMLQSYAPFERLAFLHSNAAEWALTLKEAINNLLPEGDIWLEVVNRVLCAHIDPGVVGFACVSKE